MDLSQSLLTIALWIAVRVGRPTLESVELQRNWLIKSPQIQWVYTRAIYYGDQQYSILWVRTVKLVFSPICFWSRPGNSVHTLIPKATTHTHMKHTIHVTVFFLVLSSSQRSKHIFKIRIYRDKYQRWYILI